MPENLLEPDGPRTREQDRSRRGLGPRGRRGRQRARRGGRRRGQRLPHDNPRAGARARRKGGREERRQEVLGGRSARRQGRTQHARREDHVRVEDPGGLRAALRRLGAGELRRGPRHGRQVQHGRVRDGLVHGELGLRAHPQPVGPGPCPRRLLRWLGRGRCGRRGLVGARDRHGRLGAPARGVVRHRRAQAHLRAGLALRAHLLRLLARRGRPDDPRRAGRGAPAAGHSRPRPARLHQRQRRGPRLPRRLRRWRGGPQGRGGNGAHGRAHRRRGARGRRRRGRGSRRRWGRSGRGEPAARVLRAGGVLHNRAGRGLLQPRPLRRGKVRAQGSR